MTDLDEDPIRTDTGPTLATHVDPARAAAFATRLTTVLDDACLALLISVGQRTGLFDVMAGLPSATSREVARAAALDERYVREWLGGMVVGGIVDYDPAARSYRLPPEHTAVTTTAAGTDNLAFYTQYVALLAGVESEIVRVFREGGGVPYSEYPAFQALQRAETARVFDTALMSTVLPLVPGLVARLTVRIPFAA